MNISNDGSKMQMNGRDLSVKVDPDQMVSGNNPDSNAALKTDSYDLPLMFRVGVLMDILKGWYESNLSPQSIHSIRAMMLNH
jgi:hypothetical protein